jgi:hypothetical protein
MSLTASWKHFWVTLALLLGALVAMTYAAEAATRTVGPGKTYATVCAALAVAVNGDTIAIDSVDGSGNRLLYSDDFCTFTQTGLTIQGVGTQRALIRRTTTPLPANGAMWYANPAGASTLTIQNVEMGGAHNLTQDAAPVKGVNTSFTFDNVFMRHNDNGIKGIDEPLAGGSRLYDLTITNSEIAYNGGLTQGTNWGTPVAHNISTGQCRNFLMRGTWVHDARGGNGVESKCNTSTIEYNRIADFPAGTEIYTTVAQPNVICTGETAEELNFPYGGTVYLKGNVIYQSQSTRNYAIVHWHGALAPSGQSNSADELYVTYNTIVDALGTTSTVGIWAELVTPSPFTMVNNGLAGFVSGSVVYATGASRTTQTAPANNFIYSTIAAANFSDPTNQNYHLAGSTLINAGTTDPGSAHGYSLNPTSNYFHPSNTTTRTTVGSRDMGAYESNATLNTVISTPSLWTQNGVTSTTVRWTPALADKPIDKYWLSRNGAPPIEVTGLSYIDTTPISSGTLVTYAVDAETSTDCSDPSNTETAGRILQVNTQDQTTIDPTALGWQDLGRTDIASAIPSLLVDIVDRGGFAYDTQASRLLLFSNNQTWDSNAIVGITPATFQTRLVNVSDTHLGSTGEITAGGRPNGRQTRNGVAWLQNVNQLFVSGGRRLETAFLQDTWIWTPGTDSWSQKSPSGTIPDASTHAVAYDPSSHHVWVYSNGCVDEYDPSGDSFTRLGSCRAPIGQRPSVAWDSAHRRLYICGELECGYFDINDVSYARITDFECVPLMVSFPGLAFDPTRNVVVGWIGGKKVYTIDPVTNTCSTQTLEGHPGYSPTFEVGSRFLYAQDMNAFLAVTTVSNDAFLLRLTTAPPVPQPRDFFSFSGQGSITGKGAIRRAP